MIPSITDIRRSLSDCRMSLERLCDVEPVAGQPVVRNTMFAEFAVEWQGERWLLCTPLNQRGADAVEHMARMAAKLRSARMRHLVEFRVFRSEMRFADSAGCMHRCDVVMQRLPEGFALDRVAAVLSHEVLVDELESMQAEFARAGFSHNNLKPENIIVTDDNRLMAVRCHFARIGKVAGGGDVACTGGDGRAFEELRRVVMSKPLADRKADAAERQAAVFEAADGCEAVDGEHEQRILIRRDGLYGYADPRCGIVVEPKYDRAESFREGRAEVELNGRKGLIDKMGRWVIQPRYERLEYYEESGFTLAYSDGEWSVIDYDGNCTGIRHREVAAVCRAVKERMNLTIEI